MNYLPDPPGGCKICFFSKHFIVLIELVWLLTNYIIILYKKQYYSLTLGVYYDYSSII